MSFEKIQPSIEITPMESCTGCGGSQQTYNKKYGDYVSTKRGTCSPA